SSTLLGKHCALSLISSALPSCRNPMAPLIHNFLVLSAIRSTRKCNSATSKLAKFPDSNPMRALVYLLDTGVDFRYLRTFHTFVPGFRWSDGSYARRGATQWLSRV